MHDVKTIKESFKKAQQMESDIDVSSLIEKGQLEEKIEMLHKKNQRPIFKKCYPLVL